MVLVIVFFWYRLVFCWYNWYLSLAHLNKSLLNIATAFFLFMVFMLEFCWYFLVDGITLAANLFSSILSHFCHSFFIYFTKFILPT